MRAVAQIVRNAKTTQAVGYEDEAAIQIQTEWRFEPPQELFRTGLESCGLATDDTITVLNGLTARQSLAELARQISIGQILTKRTVHGRRHFLTAIKRRYSEAPRPLPRISELAAMLPALASQVARNQILLPYFLLSDRAAFEIMISLILACRQQGETHLLKDRVLAALYMVFRRRGRKPWGDALCIRWVEGLLSVLRDVGALGRGADRERLLPYTVRPEVFSFHLWGLYDSGLRGRALYATPFWRLLLLDEREAQQLTAVVAAQGWWKLTTLGAAEELLPAFHSIGDWVSHELG
ncbi:MAG: DUF1819 family protein [Deltaproteobacteria bacterium]|nr:DUF1819 family protein [Deltaproteobacteria bacterium]